MTCYDATVLYVKNEQGDVVSVDFKQYELCPELFNWKYFSSNVILCSSNKRHINGECKKQDENLSFCSRYSLRIDWTKLTLNSTLNTDVLLYIDKNYPVVATNLNWNVLMGYIDVRNVDILKAILKYATNLNLMCNNLKFCQDVMLEICKISGCDEEHSGCLCASLNWMFISEAFALDERAIIFKNLIKRNKLCQNPHVSFGLYDKLLEYDREIPHYFNNKYIINNSGICVEWDVNQLLSKLPVGVYYKNVIPVIICNHKRIITVGKIVAEWFEYIDIMTYMHYLRRSTVCCLNMLEHILSFEDYEILENEHDITKYIKQIRLVRMNELCPKCEVHHDHEERELRMRVVFKFLEIEGCKRDFYSAMLDKFDVSIGDIISYHNEPLPLSILVLFRSDALNSLISLFKRGTDPRFIVLLFTRAELQKKLGEQYEIYIGDELDRFANEHYPRRGDKDYIGAYENAISIHPGGDDFNSAREHFNTAISQFKSV